VAYRCAATRYGVFLHTLECCYCTSRCCCCTPWCVVAAHPGVLLLHTATSMHFVRSK